jgi:hypothetical protein
MSGVRIVLTAGIGAFCRALAAKAASLSALGGQP